MLILVSGATRTFRRFQGDPRLGHLMGPRSGNAAAAVTATGHRWAADNDAFRAWDPERFRRMLARIAAADRSRLLWVAVPDVVCDAQATLDRWHEWFPQLDHLGLPAALVGQNGLGAVADRIPWHRMAALFLGGDDAWKLGPEAERFAREAKARGKWVHMGRCQTRKRIRHAIEIGCDSIDGRSFSAWPDKYFPAALRWIAGIEAQSHFLPAREPA